MWTSQDHGRTWSPAKEWARGGTFQNGIWEPFLYLDSQNRLVVVFSDELAHANWSQVVAMTTSVNGGHRPGMPTVARMDNGEYILSYEYCGLTNCRIYVKISPDGSTWGPSFDVGKPVSTDDSLYPGSSPYIVWDPATRQVVLSSHSAYYVHNDSLAPQDHRIDFTNSNYGRGSWSWSPAPWHVRNSTGACNSNYSPSLLAQPDGKIGVLPYKSDFAANDQAGWINFGADCSIYGDEYGFAPAGDQLAIAVTGSSGWKCYTIAGDVLTTDHSGEVGVMVHVTASPEGGDLNALRGFKYVISASIGNMTVSQHDGAQTAVLYSRASPLGVSPNRWYHLEFQYRTDVQLLIAVAEGSDHDLEGTNVGINGGYQQRIATRHDLQTGSADPLDHGMAGLFGRNGGGKFKNVDIRP
ncbi:hypothetical protein N7532_000559 [Penicillium argentinense]|uniref:Uncharacterized protein n=1 Tax=Penicillium argentinense TaxID=1131581 RepID=A0A9W9KMR0_9EURO|nr:uncharacterized protein N7532_000559 [Penicillium argentinense]KAJ5112514.1 hypothetical protein N7532_000559 [Penicillium argentinense]